MEGLDSASLVFAGPFANLGGGDIESPTVVSVPTGSGVGQPLYLATAYNHVMYVSLGNGTWSPITPLSTYTYCSDAPGATVVASTPGSTAAYTLVVACRGGNGALYWASGPVTAGTVPSDFTNWASLGGVIEPGISGGPAVTAVEPPSGTSLTFADELTFFVNGMTGHVFETTAAAGAAGWTQTGWECTGHLAAASYQVSGALTSAFACQGGQIKAYAAITTGAGWDTQPLGGAVIDGPGIAIGPTAWTVVAEGLDQGLFQDTSTSTTGSFSFGGWNYVGGVLTNGAEATALLTEATNP
jgi:hypothetical protein